MLGPSTVDPNLPTLETDVFRGYFAADVACVGDIVPPSGSPDPSCFTDVFGVKVSYEYCQWIWNRTSQVETRLPFPTDTYLGEGIEYYAFARAAMAASGQATFTVVELGAGWGPWVSLAAVNGHRLGFGVVSFVAFEADAGRFRDMRRHLAINGIVAEGEPNQGSARGFEWTLYPAAAHWEDGVLYWPKEASPEDAGNAAILDSSTSIDYRGVPISTMEIKAVSVAGALAHLPIIDFMHVDIQGGEAELLPRLRKTLNEKVRVLFIGTHSRKIEGDFMEFFEQQGWQLHRERPCQFYPESEAPTLVGRTYLDGAQLWLNKRYL